MSIQAVVAEPSGWGARQSATHPLSKPAQPLPQAEEPALTRHRARMLLDLYNARMKFFPTGLFADPAWDMLLDLFSAELSKARVPISSLCAAAEVPPTTALRWIRGMTASGLFERHPDPSDARRVFIALSRQSSAAMAAYFAAVG